MKKRVIISIVLLILAFSTCAVSFGMIAHELGRLRTSLYDAIYTAEGCGMSESSTNAVLCEWNDAKKSLDVFLDGEDVNEFDKLIPSLGDSLRENNPVHYFEICSECIHYIESVFDDINLNAGSIF